MVRKVAAIGAVMLLMTSIVLAADIQAPQRTMQVSGEATVMVKPDNVRVQVGVETISAELEAARQENAATFERVLAAIQELDYPDMTMKTVGFDVSTITEDKNSRDLQPPEIIGYRVQNTLTIRVTNAEPEELSQRAANIIDTAVSNGANRVGSIDIFVMDEAAYKEEAMLKAAADARRKAQRLAEAMNVTIESYRNIIAQDVQFYSPYRFRREMMQSAAVSGGEGTTLEAGMVQVHASVSLTCDISAPQ